MRAVLHDRYGGPENLTLADVDAPRPGPGEVRVRVEAASLNPYDWHQFRGEPYVMRAGEGWRVREPRIVGADLVGTVDALGDGVDDLVVGDRVLACPGRGALADLAVVRVDRLARVAHAVDAEAAAAAPMAGLAALQGLRDMGRVVPGSRVLVWGASGGVGHLALHIARALGAERVDAVASARHARWLRDEGASEHYDYAPGAANGVDSLPRAAYDVVLDTVATAPPALVARTLARGGVRVVAGALGGGRLTGPLGGMLRATIGTRVRGRRAGAFLSKPSSPDLGVLASWLEDGSLRPRVARVTTLDDAAEAFAELERGHVAGKIVVRIGPTGATPPAGHRPPPAPQ